MERKRKLIIKEGDRVVYEGEELLSYYDRNNSPKDKPVIFGMFSIKEFITACSYMVVFAVFLLKTDQRITLMEQNIKMFTEFVQNSDNYHATVLGTQFRNGKPISDNFDSARVRKVLKGTAVEEVE